MNKSLFTLITNNRQLNIDFRRGGFHIRALPTFSGVFAAHVGESGQDSGGKTIQAAIYTDLAFQTLTEILEQEVVANRGGDVFPWENLCRTPLTTGRKS